MTPDNHESRRWAAAPVPAEGLAGLSLADLREYRHRLRAEDDKVSYWRRLAHARIDVVDAESHTEGTLSFEDLVRVLGDTGTGQTRRPLIRVKAADPLPDLSELSEMWGREVDPHNPHQVADALERVRTAERQLTDYRRALQQRILAATRELIVHYREDPTRALGILRR